METVKRFVCLCLFHGDATSTVFIRSMTAENSWCSGHECKLLCNTAKVIARPRLTSQGFLPSYPKGGRKEALRSVHSYTYLHLFSYLLFSAAMLGGNEQVLVEAAAATRV